VGACQGSAVKLVAPLRPCSKRIERAPGGAAAWLPEESSARTFPSLAPGRDPHPREVSAEKAQPPAGRRSDRERGAGGGISTRLLAGVRRAAPVRSVGEMATSAPYAYPIVAALRSSEDGMNCRLVQACPTTCWSGSRTDVNEVKGREPRVSTSTSKPPGKSSGMKERPAAQSARVRL